mgnify:CR=1 FL=1|tara:strand:+ start:311 stop:964 length:654 start_codon:yes stop_codon:yes gene_type:complete
MKFVTIITPCQKRCVEYFSDVSSSINYRYVWKWIVVLGGIVPNTVMTSYLQANGGDVDYVLAKHDSTSGNVLRNVGLQHAFAQPAHVHDYIYYLDDDNVVHPSFWSVIYDEYLARRIEPSIFLFDACRGGQRFRAQCLINHVDTAQFMVAKTMSSNWTLEYTADGQYIQSKCKETSSVVYIHTIIAYYNALHNIPDCSPNNTSRCQRRYSSNCHVNR